MKNNNRNYWIAGGVIIVIIILFSVLNKPEQSRNSTNSANQTNQQNQTTTTPDTSKPTTTSTSPSPSGNFTLEGKLLQSDNKSRGNLMLVTPERTIYMTSSRDWSSFYGKNVIVSGEGTRQNFRLVDIVEKK